MNTLIISVLLGSHLTIINPSPPSRPTLAPELLPICSCESVGVPDAVPQHFNKDGTVIRGKVNSDDIGMCQINLKYHKAVADKMDLDLFKEDDNIKYANYLYNKQGTKPWNWSKKCWQK